MKKVDLRFSMEKVVEDVDSEFFDCAVECIRMLKNMYMLGVKPESCQIGDYNKEVYGYIEVTDLNTEPKE